MATNFKTNNTAVEDAYVSYSYVGYSNLWVWGNNDYNQLGLIDTVHRSSPTQASSASGGLNPWSTVNISDYHAVALKTDNTLWTWGYNNTGQLGTGDYNHRSSPVQISGAWTSTVSMSGSNGSTLGVKIDGTLWSWGYQNGGELGTGVVINTYGNVPVQVGALTNWLSVNGTGYFVLALKTNGTLWSWGYNASGQLGLNDTTSRSSPVQVGVLTTWSKVAGGSLNTGHALAIKTDGTLWSWGYNASGQLGLNDIVHRSSPVQVGALTTWSLISAGAAHSLAIKTDGTLWSWGQNSNGQLGQNDIVHRSSPVQVGALTTWSKVACGSYTSLAVKTDGTLWSWGQNQRGQLGQGDIVHRSSPVQVGALTTWNNVFAGEYISSALGSYAVAP